MKTAVLISVKPEWCEKIVSGEKTIEIRKTRPKIQPPFKCYIYCTMDGAGQNPKRYIWKKDRTGRLREIYWNGKVVGEFVCEEIDKIRKVGFTENDTRLCRVGEDLQCNSLDYEYVNNRCCLSVSKLEEYAKKGTVYGWHISGLKVYDEPKKLNEITRINKNRKPTPLKTEKPPQSWCYVVDTLEASGRASTS